MKKELKIILLLVLIFTFQEKSFNLLFSNELKIIIQGKWFNDNYRKNTFMMNQLVYNQIYEPIAKYTIDLSITYGLSKSWYVSPNWDYIEFVLNENKYFSDGTIVKSDDIKRNMVEIFKSSSLNSFKIIRDYILRKNYFKKINDRKFLIYFKKPFPKIFNFFPLSMMRISKKSPHSPYPIGTGPYAIKSIEGNKVNLIKNQYYMGKSLFFNKITFVFEKSYEKILKDHNNFDLIILMHKNTHEFKGYKRYKIKLPVLAFFSLRTAKGIFFNKKNRLFFYCNLNKSKLLRELSNLGYRFIKYERIILPGLPGYGLEKEKEVNLCKNIKKKKLKVKLFAPSPVFGKLNFQAFFNKNIMIEKINKATSENFDVQFTVAGIAIPIPFPIYLYDIFNETIENFYGKWFLSSLIDVYAETNQLNLTKKLVEFEKLVVNEEIAVIPIGASNSVFIDIYSKKEIKNFKITSPLFVYTELKNLRRD